MYQVIGDTKRLCIFFNEPVEIDEKEVENK